MRVVFYTEQYGVGGTDAVLANIFNNWPNQDDEIILMTNDDNEGMELLKNIVDPSKVKYHLFKFHFRAGRVKYTPFQKVNKVIDVLMTGIVFYTRIIKFLFLLNKVKPDVLISNNGGYPAAYSCQSILVSAWILRIKKVFLLVHHAAVPIRKYFFLFEVVMDWLAKKCVTQIISVSEASKNILHQERKFPLDMIKVIHNGMDANIPSAKINLREKYNIGSDKRIIGCVANLRPHKGHEVLIKAYNKSACKDETVLLIVGKQYDPVISNCQRLVEEYGLQDKVIFCGFLDDHPSALIKQLDLLVLPTLDFEAFGMVLGEAVLCEVPIVATTVGGVTEVFKNNEHGYLVEPNNIEELAKGLDQIFVDYAKSKQMVQGAKDHFQENFSAKRMSQGYQQFVTNGV